MTVPEDALRRSLARARDRELGERLLREGRVEPGRLEQALDAEDGQPLLDKLGLGGLDLDEPEEVRQARARPDSRVAGYVLVERLAAGALSDIWRAWEPAGRRWVALKTLQGVPVSPETSERWRREMLAAGRLAHPHLVPVYAAGEHQGRPWIAMALIRGASLDERAPGREEAVRVLHRVCLAIQHAHENGVVHRDLKPGNIILDDAGHPWVCDFGIAQVFDAPRLTAAGTLLGTAAFMAPERAAGRDSGVATDVYGLGATLYALVAGRAPYEGSDFLAILDQVRAGPPPTPSSLAPGLAADLDRIILQAMAREPEARYASAAAMAEDLSRYLQGRPVQAVVPRMRRPRTVLVVSMALAAFLAIIVALLWPNPHPAVSLRLLESARHALDRVQEAQYDPALSDQAYTERVLTARQQADRARVHAPDLALALHRWGEIEELDGRFEAAADAWTSALVKDPALAASQYRLGRALLSLAYLRRLNLWAEAEEVARADADSLARRAIERLDAARAEGFENELHRALADAMRAYVAGDHDQAASLCKDGLKAHGEGRGTEDLYWILGLAGGGAAYFDRAIDLRPRFALARFSRGVARMGESRHADAALDFTAVLAASPGFGEARLHRGSALAFAGDFAGATRDFEALLDDPRLSPGAYNGRGWVRRRNGDADGALADFDEAIRRRPATNHLGYVYRAEARLERKDYAGAAEDARAAYAIRPWSWAMNLLLQARAGTRDWAAAEADLNAFRIPPDDEARRTLRSLQRP